MIFILLLIMRAIAALHSAQQAQPQMIKTIALCALAILHMLTTRLMPVLHPVLMAFYRTTSPKIVSVQLSWNWQINFIGTRLR
jgi:hypothetical protein